MAAINFLLLKNVARVESLRKLSERKKKAQGDRRRRDEGREASKFSARNQQEQGVAKFYIVIPGY